MPPIISNSTIDLQMQRKQPKKREGKMTKADLYQALQRKQRYMPDQKSPICTVDFLLGVVKGTIHSFTTDQIRMKVIAQPPAMAILVSALQRVLDHHDIDIDVVSRRPD